jgi:hypothetical protein
MHGFTLVFLAFAISTEPVELHKDEFEIQTRRFAMSFMSQTGKKDNIECIRLFVSEDRGKSWKHEKDYKPTVEKVTFTAHDDGLYWFALQIVFKDGKSKPDELDDLGPVMKVYVNTERRTIKVRKSYGELQREVVELQKTVQKLQKKIKELEANRKPKQGKSEPE